MQDRELRRKANVGSATVYNRKLRGVPYLIGVSMPDVINGARDTQGMDYAVFDSFMGLLTSVLGEDSDTLVIVGDYCTYLRDICFNYRDGQCFLPYYSYETYKIHRYMGYRHSDMLYADDNDIYLRHSFKLNVLLLDLTSVLQVYQPHSKCYCRVRVKEQGTWSSNLDDGALSLPDLYSLYKDSCCPDAETSAGHQGGYAFISSVTGVSNKERDLRVGLGLPDFSPDNVFTPLYYRDVRNYTVEEFHIMYPDVKYDTYYWERLLKFESTLFCGIKDSLAVESSASALSQAMTDASSICKVSDGKISFIAKGYWWTSLGKGKRKTWHKVQK